MSILWLPPSESWPYPVRVVEEGIPDTCYPPQGVEPNFRVLRGCGGYGEVSKNHIHAGTQITEDPNGPYICKMCKGTGRLRQQFKGNSLS